MPHKIIYVSDGIAAQHKNKLNFLNLCMFNKDFNIKAEWNCFANSHGKAACDGIGDTVKQLVTQSSLGRMNADQIITARHLYNW